MDRRVGVCILLAYLLGSVPSAYIVGCAFGGVDIRRMGHGNVGARNTYRHLGHAAGMVVATADISKGVVSVLVARHVGLPDRWVLAVGAAAVLGHTLCCFSVSRAGKGMATSIGVLSVTLPWPTSVGLCTAGLAWVLLKRRFDLCMAIGLGAVPVLAWLTGEPPRRILYPVALLPVMAPRKVTRMVARRGAYYARGGGDGRRRRFLRRSPRGVARVYR